LSLNNPQISTSNISPFYVIANFESKQLVSVVKMEVILHHMAK
jgi:hypothetical protein